MLQLTELQREHAERYYGIAVKTANRYRHLADPDDLRSECLTAVCHAVRRYDPTQGRSMFSYVVLWCRAAAWRVIERKMKRESRCVTVVFVDTPRETDDARHPVAPSATKVNLRETDTYTRLRGRNRSILDQYLATGNKSLVGRLNGISSERVDQILTDFVKLVRGELCPR